MTTTFEGRTFDRVPKWDPRNDRYHVNALLVAAGKPTAHDLVQDKRLAKLEAAVFPPKPPAPPGPTPSPTPAPSADVVHGVTVLQDQGAEGECVGFGWSDYLASNPNPAAIVVEPLGANVETATAEKLYVLAQQFDGSTPDEQSGASTLGGAKAAQSLGFINAYHWAKTVDDVEAAIKAGLNVVTGTNWYAGQMNVDGNGFIHVTGQLAGGHEVIYHGVAGDGSWFQGRNSWGAWGINGTGDFRISRADLARLLSEQGDACVPSR